VRQDSSKSGNSKKSIAGLLHRLSSVDAGPAWVEFLDRYGQLIMNTASQFDYEQDRVDECFIFICEKLIDNGFRRLLNFNTRGSAKFQTWLSTVVFNLCVDWHRKEFGRAVMLPAISALPAFDQAVYRLVIEQQMSKEESYQTLRADFPDLTRELVSAALGRIHSLLTPRQRWQASVRSRARRKHGTDSVQGRVDRLPHTGSDPESLAHMEQNLESLQNAISRLPANQRLLLRLRFQEGLSLEKTAQLTQLGDASRTWRHIQAAVKELFNHLNEEKFPKNRKN